METRMKISENNLDALKEVTGGEDFITYMCDRAHDFYHGLIRKFKAEGKTFEMFMDYISAGNIDLLGEELLRNWFSLSETI